MTQRVVIFNSLMAGAPIAGLNVLGGLVTLLDACLVNGFNSVGVTSAVRTGDTVLVTTASNHNFAVGDTVQIEGAGEAEYNDKFRVLTKPANDQLTVNVTGSPATPATGTITIKHAPAGWTKPYAGTNTGIYRSGGSSGIDMQVEANNPYSNLVVVRMRMIKNAVGFDLGDQLGEQCRINVTAGGAWQLVADDKTCYIMLATAQTICFGHFHSYLEGDQYDYFQTRGETQTGTLSTYDGASTQSSSAGLGSYFPAILPSYSFNTAHMGITFLRDSSQLGAHVLGQNFAMLTRSMNNVTGGAIMISQTSVPMPNAADNSVPMVPIFLGEWQGSTFNLRGRLRGMYWPLGLMNTVSFVNGVLVLDDIMISGTLRRVALFRLGATNQNQIAIDLGESWD